MVWWLTKRRFARALDGARVKQAIADAELGTAGEIVVSISPFFWGNVRRAAELAFARLGIDRTRDRTGVLVFVVPSRRQLVILGDVGIHARVGDALWSRLAAEMASAIGRGDLTGAIVDGIGEIGRALAEHFPRRPDDTNELPDDVR